MSDHPSWHLEPGDVVAGRRVVRRLGGGKRTEVLLAREEPGTELVVVKLLRPGASGAAARALAAEAELLGRVTHVLFPRLVELVDDDAGRLALVIEHVPGTRLSSRLRRTGELPAPAAAALAASLADGLAALAAGGHVHLDVKPANTILSSRPRLVDLGIARSLAAAADVRGRVGSHRFQAPEQHDPEGFGGLGPATDVWGIGVTVATALRGRSPWGALRDDDGRRRMLTRDDVGTLALPGGVPAPLDRLVREMMAWDPGARPPAVAVAARARRLSEELR